MNDEKVFPEAAWLGEVGATAGGLSKREYFAAMAMQGIFSNSGMVKAIGQRCKVEDREPEEFIADAAVLAADGLLQKLEEKK